MSENSKLTSFFDDIEPSLEDSNFWLPSINIPKKISDVKQIEGVLFKKSKSSNFWKSRYFALFDDRLAYFKNGRMKAEAFYCPLQNLRVEVIEGTEKKRDTKFGIRFIRNQKSVELYARSLEIQQNWMEKLKQFCILNSYSARYKTEKLIGEGSYAKVYCAKRKSDGKEFAVKTFEKSQLSQFANSKACLINEISIMRKLTHENIVKLYEVHESESHIYLVMELLQGGDLFQRIEEKEYYKERDAAVLMKKLLEALDFMHSKGIMHRDIKLENLLLPSAKNNVDVKIADFGLAMVVSQGEYLVKKCGTPGYIAPEIFDNNILYDQKVDIFSAGVILYILLTGESPFNGNSQKAMINSNAHCNIEFDIGFMGFGISEEAIDLLRKMLAKNPKARLSAHECLQHPWIISNNANNDSPKVQSPEDLASSMPEKKGESGDKKIIRCQDNLHPRIGESSTTDSLNCKPNSIGQGNLLNLILRSKPKDMKPGLGLNTLFECPKKKAKEFQKIVSVKMSLRELF